MANSYEVGQVWTYDNRENEKNSSILILHIDKEGDGEIVHVCVRGLSISNPNNPNDMIDEITHMPFRKEALDDSVKNQIGIQEVPDYSEGYDIWRESYDAEEAGVYSITVGEAVQFMDETINESTPQSDG
jgi:hypothetical protein